MSINFSEVSIYDENILLRFKNTLKKLLIKMNNLK